MKKIVRYFAQGLIVLIPVSVTVFIFYKTYAWLRGLFAGVHHTFVNQYLDPILFLLLGLAVIVLVGMFASSVIARFFIDEAGHLLEKIPIVRTIYSPVKDFTTAFLGNDKRFSHPVLVTTNKQNNIREIGFITDEDLSELGLSKDFAAVYFPMSYAISGRLVIVPRDLIERLNVPASEAMKYIVSGGVSEVD